jgi:subtilisin family serine protease
VPRFLFLGLLVAATLIVAALGAATSRTADGEPLSYVVLYENGASPQAARAAVKASGGRVVRENAKVGVATAVSNSPSFLEAVSRQDTLEGGARNDPIGQVTASPMGADAELEAARAAARGTFRGARDHRDKPDRAEPLADLQWGMRMIHATAEESYDEERGKGVTVGIIDSGIDGKHPDIKRNFNRRLSRNFTTDIPLIDGPCEEEPDRSCSDPADVDESSHGTHVASIVGSPINKLGVAGVAPEVTLVNLRAGQDGGFVFLQPTVDAITFAGDHRIDVVNMSFFIDPWLYNCASHPADTPEQQQQQRTIVAATQRAVDYAHARGVTLIGSSGNSHEDLGAATKVDTGSPNFPPGTSHERIVDNTCIDVPTESNHVLSINALGPTTRKADYSNYGVEQSTVAAPGGWFRDDPWHPGLLPIDSPQSEAVGLPNTIWAAYPENVAREAGVLNPDGTPNTPAVRRDCHRGKCAYYQGIQGTSMASPHATGVAALIVAAHGDHGSLDPAEVQRILEQTATDHACPEPREHSYADKGRSWSNFCEGTPEFNGFYGHGIVNALAAVEDADDDH